jgi:hypothetical protein
MRRVFERHKQNADQTIAPAPVLAQLFPRDRAEESTRPGGLEEPGTGGLLAAIDEGLHSAPAASFLLGTGRL